MTPQRFPAVNAEKLEAYVADSQKYLSRIMDTEPHAEYADKRMQQTAMTAEALAKADPAEVTRRLLEYENTEKLLAGLYEEITGGQSCHMCCENPDRD